MGSDTMSVETALEEVLESLQACLRIDAQRNRNYEQLEECLVECTQEIRSRSLAEPPKAEAAVKV